MAGHAKDMTQGKPLGLIARLAIPICFENMLWMVLNALVNMIIGRGVGSDALAAIGATNYAYYLFSWFSVGMAQCIAGIAGMYFGYGDRKRLNEAVNTAVFLSLLSGTVLCVLGLVLSAPLLRVLGTPEGIFSAARRYLIMQFIMLIGATMHYVLSYMMISLGDGIDPIIDICILGGSAVILCYLLVHFTRLGVLAGSISLGCGCILASLFDLYALKKMGAFAPKKGTPFFSPRVLREMIRKSIPFGIQLSVSAVGGMLMQAALNVQGEAVVAAFTTATSLSAIPQGIQSAIGYVMNSYVSQNYGAGKITRIRRGVISAMVIGGCIWAGIACMQIFGGKVLLSLYVSKSDPQAAAVIQNAYQMLLVMTACSGGIQMLYMFRSSLIGIGKPGYAVFGMAAEFVGRAFTAMLFPMLFGLPGVFCAEPFSWALGGIAHCIVFFVLYARLKRTWQQT